MSYTETEKRYMSIIQSNISYFNTNHKDKLVVNYYVDNGNKADVEFNGKTVLCCIPIEGAFYAVAGIINSRR